MTNWYQLDRLEHGDKVVIRHDIPQELRQEMFQELVLDYRAILGGEPEAIHRIEKATAIGMLENAIRTKTKLALQVSNPGRTTRSI